MNYSTPAHEIANQQETLKLCLGVDDPHQEPLWMFGRDNSRSDGTNAYCRPCARERMKRRRDEMRAHGLTTKDLYSPVRAGLSLGIVGSAEEARLRQIDEAELERIERARRHSAELKARVLQEVTPRLVGLMFRAPTKQSKWRVA